MFRTIALTLAILAAGSGAAQAQGLDGRLKKIAATKTINIAYRTDATPFAFQAEGKPAGFSVDLCKRVASSIERQLKLSALKVNWVPVTVESRFDVITQGRADMECGSSTVTLARMQRVDFSSYIFLETTGVLVKGESGVRAFADLAGKKVAVVGGTTNERSLKLQIEVRKLAVTVVPMRNSDEGFAALNDGKVDAFASDKLLLIGAASRAKDTSSLAILPEDLSFEPYSIALPRNESSLRLAVNTGLAKVYGSGEIKDIYDRWFKPFGRATPLLESLYIFGSIPE
ncbi:MAG: family 3 extracellular solute-binding protein [Betaproteobacteria bacterium]|nr:family 3 extracellular solute-binding protein [Betaproteobacteria bacterium]